MKYSNTVEYNIKTSLDSKGLTQLKSELQGLELKLQNMGNKGLLDEKTFVNARNQIQGLGQALSDAFNPSLGMLDLSKLNQELKNNDVTAQGLKTAFSSLGAEGQVAFNNLVGELGKLDTGILRTNSQIDKLFTTFSNTFRWGLVSSFFSQFMNAIHSSVDYVKELDDSLTQIMLVTDYNRDSMNEFAKSANEAAKAVSMTTTGMTNASLIFAQQGYDLGQSQELATLSAKLANASQQDTATTSDQITAYMNAYGLENSIEELTQQMDNWALIANVSAADVGELAQASQRAASMANAVGVSGEQLAAQIATIESVTREAPEQIGNGLKTLYARFSDIAAGKEDEDGFTLGKVTSQLNAIGVQVFDKMGQIRDVGDIMEDLMFIWEDLDQTSKVAASQALAGKYQVNRFMALMDNSNMYEEYKGATGSAATGTLDQMNEEFANSIEGRSAKLQASLEGLFSTVFNTDDIYPWMDAAQGAVDLLQQFFDALGGGKTVLLGISSLLMQIFSKNMAQEINNAATNRAVQQQKLENLQNSQAALTTLGAANPNPSDANSQNIVNFAQYMQAKAKNFNAEQMNQANSILQELVQNSNAATMATDKLKESLSIIGTGITATTGESILAPFLDSEGAVNATLLSEALQNMSQSEIMDMFSHIQDDIKPAREGLLEFNRALQNYQQELRDVNSTDDSWSQSLSNLKAALDNLDGKIDPSTYERYEQTVNEISQVTENAGDKTAETTAEVAKLADGLEKVAAKDLTNLDRLNNDAFQAKNTQMAAEDSNKVARAFREGMGSQDYIQEILNTFNAVQQLTFAWQAFQNLGSLWSNEDLSAGEKILQTIMNLTMAMPQLITAMQTLQNNSFLQNIGNGLLNILRPGSNFSDMASSVNTFQSFIQQGEEAQQVIDELQYKIDLAKQAMELREGLQNKLTEAGKAGSILQSDKAKSMNMEELQALSKEANKAKEYAKSLEEVKEATEGIIETGKEAGEALQVNGEMLKNTAKNGQEASQALDQMPGVFTKMYAASLAAGGGMAGFKAALDVAKTSMLEFLSVSGPFLAIGLAIGAVALAIGAAQEQAKKAHEQIMADFEDAKNAQQQAEEFSTKIDDWKSKRQENGDSKELAQEADELANSLREAGNAAEANALHLAAVKAEVSGMASDFDALEDAATRAQQAMSDQSALNTMNAANEILKDRLSTTEEIAAAQEALQGAALDYNLNQASRTNGMEMGVLNTAGDSDLHAATMDWQSLNSILEQSVPGFKEITDENERLSLALAHTSDEAQRAAIEIQQVLNANDSLSSSRTVDYGAGDIGNFNEREDIVRQLENTGLSAEESLQLLVTVDNSSYETMTQDIQTVMEHLNDGEPFSIAIKAIMDEEETEEYVKSQLSAYEPKDEDVSKEAFDSLTDTFYESQDQMGVEGTPFEDYSENLFENAEALEDVVEGILRYNDAIASLDENYDDWKDALENTNELSNEHLAAVDELQETYSDFLGLSKKVSKNFASNAENLELMQEAAEGDTQAFEDLEDAAAVDIYMQITGIEDLDTAKSKIEEINSILADSGIEEIPIGEIFNLDDFPEVRDAINSELAALGLDAEQAAQYVQDVWHLDIPANQFAPIEDGAYTASQNAADAATSVAGVVEGVTDTIIDNGNISMHTDVQSETATKEDQIAFTNITPTPGPEVEIPSTFPVGSASPTAGGSGAIETQTAYAHVHGVTYEPHPVTESQVKEMTGYGMETKLEKGGGKGGVSLPSGAQGSRRPSGGSGRSGASRPSGGGGGGGSCFIAGTLITTLTGFKPIEEIQKGDIVLSYNEKIKVNEYSEVLQTMIHDTIEPIYTLYIKDEQLRVTGIHRFLVTDKITCGVPQWIHAADLKVGSWIMFADGSWHVIHKIDINIEHRTVYNFEVSHNHNYYVGRNQILAHNKGGKSCFVAGTQISTSLGFKAIETIQPNDVVLSYNEQTGYNEYSSVVQTMIHDTKEPIYTLYIQNEQLRVTGIHRFFITKNILTGIPQWIAAENLKVGDWVLFANGTWHVIWKIEVDIEQQIVYNFEVSGNHNYYVGCHQILAHNKGGGKKGGGGGKAKEIKPKEKKEKKEHEKDYYEEVEKQLDKTEKVLKNIEKQQEKLTGDKARSRQNKQITLLQKEVQLNQEKLNIMLKQEKVDVTKAMKKADKEAEKIASKQLGYWKIPDAVYDEDGMIANYEQISKAIDDGHNKLLEKYNKKVEEYNVAAKAGNESRTKEIEEEMEKLEKEIDKYDKEGEKILKNGKRLNEITVESEELKNTIQELNDAIQDIRIDAYKASQEAIDELKELKEQAAELDGLFRNFDDKSFMNAFSIDDTPVMDMVESMSKLDNIYNVSKKDANDFYQNLIDKKKQELKNAKDDDEKKAIQTSIDFFKNQQSKLSNSNGLQNGLLGLANEDLAQLEKWMKNPKAKDNPFGDNISALQDAYKDALDRSVELFKDYRETVQDLRDSIIDIYDDQEDAIERQMDNYDRLLDKLERVNDTYQLYYGEDSYQQILNIMDQQGASMQSRLNDLKSAYAYWQQEYQKAIATGDKKLIQEIEDKMNDAEDSMLDAAEELAEHWVERFETSVEAAIQKVDTKLWGGGPGKMDFEDQTMIWELQKDYMDTYKDDVEKAYEVDKLRTKYINLLNDAQGMSLQTQNKIRAQMQEQLDLLGNQNTMSEYDVKLANAKLEILQKQIALEDAQRNKNKMQLRRDTQGNYRYVYTADQGDVQQAQDELNESQYNAYEMTKEQTIANNDRAISLYQDYMNKMRDIANKYKDDDVARNAAMKALSEEYAKLLEALGEDFKDTTNGMYDVLTWMVENGTQDTATAAMDMLNQLYDENGKVKENTENDWRDLATKISEEVLPNIQSAAISAITDIDDQAKILKDNMVGDNGALTTIRSGADQLTETLGDAKKATEEWASATRDLFEAFNADKKPMQEAMKQLTEMEKQLKANQTATSTLSTKYKQANANLQAEKATNLNYRTTIDLLTGARDFKAGDVVTLKKGTFVTYNRDGKSQWDSDKKVGFKIPKDTKVQIHAVGDKLGNGSLAPYDMSMYPTGDNELKYWGPLRKDTMDEKGMNTENMRHQLWHISSEKARSVLTYYDTGGYTGDWNENTDLYKDGKLAVLHQKELVLNAADSQNILAAISIMRDMFGTNVGTLGSISQLGRNVGTTYNPLTEQRVEIQAHFPNATDAEDIRAALLGLSDKAYQYAHRSI